MKPKSAEELASEFYKKDWQRSDEADEDYVVRVWLAGHESRDPEIAELRAMIEKVRNREELNAHLEANAHLSRKSFAYAQCIKRMDESMEELKIDLETERKMQENKT